MCGPDFDFGSGPNLIRLPSGRELLGIGQKSGEYWVLNPKTGALAWDTLVGPGSAFGGIQWGSATDGRHIYAAIRDVYGARTRSPRRPVATSTIIGGSWADLDAATGKILWQVADPQQAADLGYVTTANGLVYAARTLLPGTICTCSTRPSARSCGASPAARLWRPVPRSPAGVCMGDPATPC